MNIAIDARTVRLDSATLSITSHLAPLLGAAGSLDEAEKVAALVPKIRPMVEQLLLQIEAASRAEQQQVSIETRAVYTILSALMPYVVPDAAVSGTLTALFGALPNLVQQVQQHFTPDLPIVDRQDGPIVHDDGAPAVHE